MIFNMTFPDFGVFHLVNLLAEVYLWRGNPSEAWNLAYPSWSILKILGDLQPLIMKYYL